MEIDKSWKQKAIEYVTEHWGTYPNREWDYSEGHNCYLAGVAEFKKKVIEELEKQSTCDLAIGIINNLKI